MRASTRTELSERIASVISSYIGRRSRDLTDGRKVAVVLFEPSSQAGAVVFAVWT